MEKQQKTRLSLAGFRLLSSDEEVAIAVSVAKEVAKARDGAAPRDVEEWLEAL